MVKGIYDGRIVLSADEGKWLVKNGNYVKSVIIGTTDSEENWSETDERLVEKIENEE